jgi:hypothetical protein
LQEKHTIEINRKMKEKYPITKNMTNMALFRKFAGLTGRLTGLAGKRGFCWTIRYLRHSCEICWTVAGSTAQLKHLCDSAEAVSYINTVKSEIFDFSTIDLYFLGSLTKISISQLIFSVIQLISKSLN